MAHVGVLPQGRFGTTQARQQMHQEVLYPPPLCRVGRPLNLRFKVGSLMVSLGFSVKTEHAHQNRVRPPFVICWIKALLPITNTAGEYTSNRIKPCFRLQGCASRNYGKFMVRNPPSQHRSRFTHCADRFRAVLLSCFYLARFILRPSFRTGVQARFAAGPHVSPPCPSIRRVTRIQSAYTHML